MLGLVLATYILINLREVLVPFCFALIISILLIPLVNKFIKMGINRIVAIVFAMLIALIIFSGIMYFLSSQIAALASDIPLLKSKFQTLLTQFQHWVQITFGMSIEKQVGILNNGIEKAKSYIGQTVGTALGTIMTVILLPVYVFLLLFYKSLLVNFFYEVNSNKHSKNLSEILGETKIAVQSYMQGLLMEAFIITVLYTSVLLFFGIKYAILMALMGAIINMLPFIGGVLSIILPVVIATITKEGYSTQFWIIISYTIIQFADNHYIIPMVVSSKVKINALFSIIVVLLGGAIWGFGGMFLSIPFVGILKIVFDRIEEMKPWGKLLGNEVPSKYRKKKLLKTAIAEQIVENK